MARGYTAQDRAGARPKRSLRRGRMRGHPAQPRIDLLVHDERARRLVEP